jgi:hypothetical protein
MTSSSPASIREVAVQAQVEEDQEEDQKEDQEEDLEDDDFPLRHRVGVPPQAPKARLLPRLEARVDLLALAVEEALQPLQVPQLSPYKQSRPARRGRMKSGSPTPSSRALPRS